MFTQAIFAPFEDPTLTGRLGLIRRDVHPLFEAVGQRLLAQLEASTGLALTLHLAQHRRRFKNPPPDTWLALATNPRGYKMQPHIEVGIWDDRLFIWLAMLQESKPVQLDATWWQQAVSALPSGLELSGDHTKKVSEPLSEEAVSRLWRRFETTKAGEFLVGKTLLKTDPLWQTPEAVDQLISQTVAALGPLLAKIG